MKNEIIIKIGLNGKEFEILLNAIKLLREVMTLLKQDRKEIVKLEDKLKVYTWRARN